MKIAVASPRYPGTIEEGLSQVNTLAKIAAQDGAVIVCFPETYIPGYPLPGQPHTRLSQAELNTAFQMACSIAADNNIALILPMDWYEGEQFLNVAQVIGPDGSSLGYQAKVQLDPSEDAIWDAGHERKLFEVNGLVFGISICHEGFRYPETVRWAARQGAQIVFHPHFAGSDKEGYTPETWGSMQQPYYEKAMMMRALENTIYFASSNYYTKYPESASSLLAPDGSLIAHQPYTESGVFTCAIDLSLATGILAKRWKAI
ncbi:carbon-nitrogen hydrolase family protein [Filimonas effusa]|uniref:Carbon-nitrogen hydrolase family protein n=1 Tax=Filimonas effusa TaxID=2508721 RepID=A0A4Q1DC41_9BACT|nr:carbon-nitrogen hydrolase family protein [Filimonas effusa]RXK87074.1 carbon-nitrogen hydrolase family protein [Filimonas effusa]